MKSLVSHSSNFSQDTQIPVDFFRLNTQSNNKPSVFEVVIEIDKLLYRYGFEATSDEIIKEWLYFTPKTKESLLFFRNKDKYRIGRNFRKESRLLKDKTRDKVLFLNVVAQFNGYHSMNVTKWFQKIKIITGYDDSNYKLFTLVKLQDKNFRKKILTFLKGLDLSIQDIISDPNDLEESNINKSSTLDTSNFLQSSIAKPLGTKTQHNVFDSNGSLKSTTHFDLESGESDGTKKLIYLSAPIIDTLEQGNILVIDEIDSRFHSIVVEAILRVFNSKDNKKNSQIIFTTHNTNILSSKLLRRDQIWFTEKNKMEETDLYSLSDFKIRKDASFEKDYLYGRYGGIPFIKDKLK